MGLEGFYDLFNSTNGLFTCFPFCVVVLVTEFKHVHHIERQEQPNKVSQTMTTERWYVVECNADFKCLLQ